MQKKPSQTKASSLLSQVALYGLGLLGLIFLSIGTGFFESQFFIKNQQQEFVERSTAFHAQYIKEHLDIYQRLTDTIAKNPITTTLILNKDGIAAEAWALQQKTYLFNNLGLTLIDQNFNTMGDTQKLRIGPLCIKEIHKLNNEGRERYIPVHREYPGLEHYDLYAPIKDEFDDTIGYVMASFYLDDIQQDLEFISNENTYLSIHDHSDKIIATTGTPNDGIEISKPIGDSGWYVKQATNLANYNDLSNNLYLYGGIIILTSVIIMALFMLQIHSQINMELVSLRDLLRQINNPFADTQNVQAQFSETQEIMDEIQTISQKISHQQRHLFHLSHYDELTQMPNRLHFNQSIHDYQDLLDEGKKLHISMVDIVDLKRVNTDFSIAIGDSIISLLANDIEETLPSGTLAARLQGNTFVAALLDWNEPQIRHWYDLLSERFNSRCLSLQVVPAPSIRMAYTTWSKHDQALDETITRAENILFDAKRKNELFTDH